MGFPTKFTWPASMNQWRSTASACESTTVWSQAIIQTCVVHLLRNCFRYARRQHWDAIAKALKPVCTAATEAPAYERFAEFAEAWAPETRPL
jgi:transposase-like protein